MLSLCFAVFTLAPMTLRAGDATVHLLVVGAYGQVRTGCKVESFRNLDRPIKGGGFEDYREFFIGLEGKGIPYARYEVSVRCPNSLTGGNEIQVDLPLDFNVISTRERVLWMHDAKPALDITLTRAPKAGEVWWVRLVGVYGGSDLMAQFSPTAGVARVYDPQPGRYVAFVHSSAGFSCLKQLDIFDAPKRWSFAPEGCSFELDDRAKVVPDSRLQ